MLVFLAGGIPLLCAAPLTEKDLVETGRHIYEQGILPDGLPLCALRDGEVLFEGKRAACAACHRHSGMGSIEGSGATTVLVPPVAGSLLFRPARFNKAFLDHNHHWVPNDAWARALKRSAYDEKSLGRALREGLDADGKALLMPMPRYALDDDALMALNAYLNRLAAEDVPGVETGTLHLATVITPDAPAGHAEAVLGVLRNWSARARGVAKTWKLHVWRLDGPAESWSEQLQEHYRQQAVFAVLSGAGGAQWMPVHRFCEENRIPCVLPSLELAPESPDDHYSVYFSPGVALEARVLARHLDVQTKSHSVVQMFSDATGSHASQALRSRMETGAAQITDRHYSGKIVKSLIEDLPRDGSLVLWLRSTEIQQLVAAAPEGPDVKHVYLSALLAPPEVLTLPPQWKRRVSWVSLFDDFGVQTQIAKARLQRWLDQQGISYDNTLRVQADAYAACYLFTTALSEIKSEEVRRHTVPLNREHLIETLETLVNKYSDGTRWVNSESHIAYYGRMSLGPGQRMAVRGGSLLRYAAPESNKLVVTGDRIVP